ncbi:MnhB domain-containing protein [Methanolapillus millepedarum]|uniref:Na+/H+ antiporter MnhB subunit-related protein domain-containing protein n=1 Tax=Methanolapillus millepedarum TaxID=3028296 RepID=A0AA96V3A6_9EURY|nr:hypothetical protein MsAc7_13120 [Methanosarcinaceae archaeon Ac7]
MTTIIAKTISKACLVICLFFSIYLLLNGGNYPGGGFVGGVLFVCGIALVYVTYGMRYINVRLQPDWLGWVGYGLLFASVTALAPLFVGHNYFRSAFDDFPIEILGIHIGHIELISSMYFDVGVYFAVIGGLLFILTNIASDKVRAKETESPFKYTGTADSPVRVDTSMPAVLSSKVAEKTESSKNSDTLSSETSGSAGFSGSTASSGKHHQHHHYLYEDSNIDELNRASSFHNPNLDLFNKDDDLNAKQEEKK